MTDWLGTTTFELDFLHQLTAATDHAGKRVEYTYDAEGNVLTVTELNQNLPQIVADYNERFSHSKSCPLYGSVKDYAASCADLQQLYEAVGWAAEGGLYAEA